MGAKITIDSATLMNKGLEVIEAKWLFDLHANQIDVIVHPQSIVHSMVQFEDGSIKAQMGLPDMKLPIQYALHYPYRLKSGFPRFNFTDYPTLTFEKPDLETFRNLAIAYEALEKGGNAACTVNAANEVAVDAFLHDKISFLEISDIIIETLARTSYVQNPTYSDYVQTNEAARRFATDMIQVKV
jgi:1-deoxy-D-xylulose-5-phosphate reductoisomerase